MAEKKELSFEENLEKLETIVKNLENVDIPIYDAISEFNEAMKIAKICDTKLKNAEDSLNKIVKEDGSIEDFNIESN